MPFGRREPPRIVTRDPPQGVKHVRDLVSRSSSEGVIRLGQPMPWYKDFYHRVLMLRWWTFTLLAFAFYLLLNLLFAGLYLLQAGTIDHARAGSFADAFFFSIQTMATIGYGVLTPSGAYANLVVTAETMVALVFVTFITGSTFARFSRPSSRVDFSRVMTVAPHDGVPTLAVRLSNSRRNQIIEATVSMTLVRNERTLEGRLMRRFYDLTLARSHTPIFALTFTAMHPIDEDSPLYGLTPEALQAAYTELLVSVTGLDETMSQTIHARASYRVDEIRFGHRFADMFGFTADGQLALDFACFDQVIPLENPAEVGQQGLALHPEGDSRPLLPS